MKNNRSCKGHGFRFITRRSIWNVAITVDGIRVTDWYKSFTEAKAAFAEQISDLMIGIGDGLDGSEGRA